jgi:hypothetical protein
MLAACPINPDVKPLEGDPRNSLTLDRTSLDFGRVRMASVRELALQLRNLHALTARDLQIAIPSGTGFTLAGTNCPRKLPPGDDCTLRIRFTPHRNGPNEETLQITSSTATATARLLGTGLARLEVKVSGDAMGRIVSYPPGISCPPACTADFSEQQVSLHAESPGDSIIAWTPHCRSGDACTLALQDSLAVEANYRTAWTLVMPTSSAVAGDASGNTFVLTRHEHDQRPALHKYAPDGARLWSISLEGNTFFAPPLATDRAGNTAVVLHEGTRCQLVWHDPDGNPLTAAAFECSRDPFPLGLSLHTDVRGTTILLGDVHRDLLLRQYSATRAPSASHRLTSEHSLLLPGLATQPDGTSLFAVVQSYLESSIPGSLMLYGLNAAGELAEVARYPILPRDWYPKKLLLASFTGDAVILGDGNTATTEGFAAIREFSPQSEQSHPQLPTGIRNRPDRITDAATDSHDCFAVLTLHMVLKWCRQQGVSWERKLPNDLLPTSIAFGHDGGVLVVAGSWIRRYPP